LLTYEIVVGSWRGHGRSTTFSSDASQGNRGLTASLNPSTDRFQPRRPDPDTHDEKSDAETNGGDGEQCTQEGSVHHGVRRIGEGFDILPAMNDQDSNRSPGGNVLRFALHRQGQNSQVSARCHGIALPRFTQLLV
jgi:hypothetical protein